MNFTHPAAAWNSPKNIKELERLFAEKYDRSTIDPSAQVEIVALMGMIHTVYPSRLVTFGKQLTKALQLAATAAGSTPTPLAEFLKEVDGHMATLALEGFGNPFMTIPPVQTPKE